MLDNMRRLHPRGAASRGICVDLNGAMLGPDCVLVQRTSRGYRGIERSAAAALQKTVFEVDRERDWLFRQAGRIADALDKGEIALAQIYGLHIPIYDLDHQQLTKLSVAARLTKTGYNPDEPRLPKGDPHGGEWTTGGGGSVTSPITAPPTGPLAIDAMTVDNGDGDASTGSGEGAPASNDAASGGGPAGSASDEPPIKWEMKPLPNPSAPLPPISRPDNQPPSDSDDTSEGPSTLGSPDLDPTVPIGSDPTDGSGNNGTPSAAPNTLGVDAINPDYSLENLLFLLATGGLGWTPGALLRALTALGLKRPVGFVAHHIVAKGALIADPARAALERLGIGIDDPVNGVFLPELQHSRLHSTAYYTAINNALANAKTKSEAEQILRSLAHMLKEGTFP